MMKQKSWPESEQQRGAACQCGPAAGGPRSQEDGVARGAPRRRAGLQPTGHIDELGPPVGLRGKRITIPLHKASRRAADTLHVVNVKHEGHTWGAALGPWRHYDEQRESAPYGWSRVETGATMVGEESRGSTTNKTHHD